MTWYVVSDPLACDPQPEEAIWTLSRNPKEPGWCTDCGYKGYGLTWGDAKELADAANAIAERGWPE